LKKCFPPKHVIVLPGLSFGILFFNANSACEKRSGSQAFKFPLLLKSVHPANGNVRFDQALFLMPTKRPQNRHSY
jgi:hypothetical protein